MRAAHLYGGFPVKRLVWVTLTVFCSGGETPSFAPSPAIRFAERAEGVKGPKRQQSLAACRLATLVFRSALTPEHAEGRWTGGEGPFFERSEVRRVGMGSGSRGARHWGAYEGRTLVWGFSCQAVGLGYADGFLFGRGDAFFRPLACDQVRGARGRGQGTETAAKLGGLPLSDACVSQRLDT